MYGMGYGGGDPYADYQQLYEEQQDQYEEEPPQRQNAPRSPGLRAYMKQMASENKALKKELEDQRAMLQELMDGESPQLSQGVPQSRLTQEEQLQMTRLQSMGVVGVAPPQGTQNEQVAAIRSMKSPDELITYLRGQGSVIGQNYEGMGY